MHPDQCDREKCGWLFSFEGGGKEKKLSVQQGTVMLSKQDHSSTYSWLVLGPGGRWGPESNQDIVVEKSIVYGITLGGVKWLG